MYINLFRVFLSSIIFSVFDYNKFTRTEKQDISVRPRQKLAHFFWNKYFCLFVWISVFFIRNRPPETLVNTGVLEGCIFKSEFLSFCINFCSCRCENIRITNIWNLLSNRTEKTSINLIWKNLSSYLVCVSFRNKFRQQQILTVCYIFGQKLATSFVLKIAVRVVSLLWIW